MKGQISKTEALRAVRARLPILGDRSLQRELDFAVGGCPRCSDSRALAEAYRLGAVAAQGVIADRIAAMGTKSESKEEKTQ